MTMRSGTIVFGTILTVCLMFVALWGWQHAESLVEAWAQPALAANAVRCAAIAVMAGAQIVLLWSVVGQIYRSGRFDTVCGLMAAGVCTVAIVSAVTLALAGR
jgi:hypothetical protein